MNRFSEIAGHPLEKRLAGLSADKLRLLESMVRDRTGPLKIPKRGLQRAPLSFGQERLWFLHQMDPDNSAYHLHFHLSLPGALDLQAWKKAWTLVVQRHEILRTRFITGEHGPEQAIEPPYEVEWAEIDLCDCEPCARWDRARAIASEQANTPFDLAKAPLFRMAILRIPDQLVQLVTVHHIIMDAWSMDVLMRDVNTAYAATLAGTHAPLPPLAIQYSDYACWQREQLTRDKIEPLLAHWRENLAGMTALQLPGDRPRSVRFTGAAGTRSQLLNERLTRSLKTFAKREGLTLYMVLLAGFAALLHRYTGQEDLVLGTPVAGRDESELESLIGFFLNTIVLRIPVHGADSFRTILGAVKAVTVRAYSNQQLPFARLVEDLQPQRNLQRNALYQVTFHLLQTRHPVARASAVLDDIGYQKQSTDVDLAVDLFDSAEGVMTRLEFSRDLFEESTIERLLARWERLLTEVMAHPDTAIDELPLTTADERALLIEDWSGARQAGTWPAATLADWFRDTAIRYAGEISIISPDQVLTYGELDLLTDQLAVALQQRGAKPEEIVGIHLTDSRETVVAIVASWKAGAAYVYLDPELPQLRLDRLLADTNPCVLLSDSDTWWRDASPGRRKPEPIPHDANALAAVMYTSGSTGTPKGVMLEQRALLQQIGWFQHDLALTPQDRVLQKYSFSFDAALAEVLNAFACGAAIVTTAGHGRDLDELITLVRTQGVTALDMVPSSLSTMLDHPDIHECVTLRRFICGGERLTATLVNRCRDLLPQLAVINAYGPAEATITATYAPCPPDTLTTDPPLGRPVPGYEAYVLSRTHEPVPIGMQGDLYLGGAGLARGYLKDDAATAARFVAHPFRQGERLYMTGDRARFREDGMLEFLGRSDHQVKLRGFRIELEEIENALRTHAVIEDAGVAIVPVAGLGLAEEHRLLTMLRRMSVPEAEFLLRLESQDGKVGGRTMWLKSSQFELYLHMPDDHFMATPQETQRHWLLRRALNELGCDLHALDRISRRLVRGGERPEIGSAWKTEPVQLSSDELVIDGQQVMQAWERPLMAALADVAAASHGDVLEVGFGMGIAATFLQERGLRSHTILECNDDVAERLKVWAGRYPDADIRVVGSRWQDWKGPESIFDAILFDTYPTSEEEYSREVLESPTFAAGFFPRAAELLRPGGIFTYYSNEIDSLGREHQRLLLRHFQSFSVSLVRGLNPPPGCQYWWADSMAVVRAVK